MTIGAKEEENKQEPVDTFSGKVADSLQPKKYQDSLTAGNDPQSETASPDMKTTTLKAGKPKKTKNSLLAKINEEELAKPQNYG